MHAPCPSCTESMATISSNAHNWRGERHQDRKLTTLFGELGLPRIEESMNCRNCGYNGWPQFSREDATEFVNALIRDAGVLALGGDFVRARRRYVRALAIFPDYSPALQALACTFFDEPPPPDATKDRLSSTYNSAVDLLLYAKERGAPPIPFVDWLLGARLQRRSSGKKPTTT